MNFIRYPGGKRKLLSYLINYLPASNFITGQYIEPFVGGGAVYFYIQPKSAILSDLNEELTDLYKGIKKFPKKVWDAFSSFPSGKKSYYDIRDSEYKDKPLYYRAARILYLNRTCFKGMWRHSPNGNFNVGYGGEDRRWVITYESIKEVSKSLKSTKIFHSDFEKIISSAKDGDFIFLDPPYKPGEKDLKHAHYINGQFSFDEQKRLADTLKLISKRKNVRWVMTNSSHPSIKGLYRDFRIKIIPMGTGSKVGILTNQSKEIIITNY